MDLPVAWQWVARGAALACAAGAGWAAARKREPWTIDPWAYVLGALALLFGYGLGWPPSTPLEAFGWKQEGNWLLFTRGGWLLGMAALLSNIAGFKLRDRRRGPQQAGIAEN